MIPETEICRKHVKKCSGSVETAATETWETVMYPLTETRVCRCVSATESRVSTMFKFTDTWFFVPWEVAVERELAVYDRWKKGSPTGTKKRVRETLLKKNVEVPTEMKFEVVVVIITFQMACQVD